MTATRTEDGETTKRSMTARCLAVLIERRTILKRLWHCSVVGWSFVWMTASLIQTLRYADPDSPHLFFRHGYKFKEYFFCLWMATVYLVYYLIYAGIDYIEVYKSDNERLLKWTDHLHTAASFLLFSLVLPLSLLIIILFWGMFYYDREYIYPEYMESLFPMWINHALHTAPAPLAVAYLVLSNKVEPPKMATSSALIAFLGVYAFFFFRIWQKEGQWVYIMLEGLDFGTVFSWFVFNCALSLLILLIGHKMNSYVPGIREGVLRAVSSAAGITASS